ncbi:glycoside hydrolase family 61 protein [Collybiopsis luxurians FD-317 M1]|uniref:lytic cellulose monooxygenase (C4-dehydrogenating) n=1 Tax=Collybiopsis luxurians FD-317 M1 TaxID=944289 RepID=A0A0D0C7D5_9AGAR|nr:glycoside hydrolase family 61 protein [Collybiopsis luxurians FD-317 M1]
MISALFVSLVLSSLVSAHGWLNSVAIGTQTFKGNVPNASPTASVIRQINDVDPVKGANNSFLACGQNAQSATQVASANPGDNVAFSWVNGDAGPWVHNTGPMMTYMASCGDQNCSSFDVSTASWFKIQEQGRVTPGGAWAMSLMNSGAPANVTIPSNIAPGNYIIRHELLALQIAQTLGGAEWYPACVQLQIGGNGTGAPTSDELVKLPGAYSDSDPGVLVDAYSNPNADYVFPGPQVAAFVNGSSTGTADANSTASASGSATAASTSAATSGSSGSCMKKKKRAADQAQLPRPRTVSRVMKNIVIA